MSIKWAPLSYSYVLGHFFLSFVYLFLPLLICSISAATPFRSLCIMSDSLHIYIKFVNLKKTAKQVPYFCLKPRGYTCTWHIVQFEKSPHSQPVAFADRMTIWDSKRLLSWLCHHTTALRQLRPMHHNQNATAIINWAYLLIVGLRIDFKVALPFFIPFTSLGPNDRPDIPER